MTSDSSRAPLERGQVAAATTSADQKPFDPAYHAYQAWKSWDGNSHHENPYFDAQFRQLALNGAHVLEIGFGDGALLRWARSRGAKTTGTEIIDNLVEREISMGGQAFLAESFPWDSHAETYDFVFAMDVCEHLAADELINLFRRIHTALKDTGLLFVRSPNMASPFGLVYQHGDPTHKISLSPKSLEYLAYGSGLEMVEFGNPKYPAPWARPVKAARVLRACLLPVRRILQYMIGLIFYDTKPFALDSNFVAKFRKGQLKVK